MNIKIDSANNPHRHTFIFSVLWYDHDRGVPGKILNCRCGAQCFESIVKDKIYKSFCKNGKEYYSTIEVDPNLLK